MTITNSPAEKGTNGSHGRQDSILPIVNLNPRDTEQAREIQHRPFVFSWALLSEGKPRRSVDTYVAHQQMCLSTPLLVPLPSLFLGHGGVAQVSENLKDIVDHSIFQRVFQCMVQGRAGPGLLLHRNALCPTPRNGKRPPL